MSTITSAIRAASLTVKSEAHSSWPSADSGLPWASEALSLVVLPAKTRLDESHPPLVQPLPVQVRSTRGGVIASTYLNAEEYGWGPTENEAIADLMLSLVEYMKSLQARKGRLSGSASSDLSKLRQLFELSSD